MSRTIADGCTFDAGAAGTLAPPLGAHPSARPAGDERTCGLTFLDINTFFSCRAGGIRTFYQAKIDYFGRQSRHRYVLVFPGPRHAVRREGQAVSLVEAFGPVISQDPAGYRFMLDYRRVLQAVRTMKPDVIEVGDPWLTGLFCLTMRRLGLYRGLLVSFCHSDPILTHLEPWARSGRLRMLKRRLVLRPLAALFYALQRSYDLTVVASSVMEERLRSRGVPLARMPLGVPAPFFTEALPPRPAASEWPRPARLLFVGRLNPEKGIELIKAVLPRLLARGHGVTIVGRGAETDYFAALKHPRLDFRGFVEDPTDVRAIYDGHDILLAPGAVESFGLAALEAMARGLAVVGPDEGGTGELLRRAGSPFVFRAGDTEAFFAAVLKAIDADREAEARRSHETALRYGTLDQAMGRLADLYAERLLQPATGRAA